MLQDPCLKRSEAHSYSPFLAVRRTVTALVSKGWCQIPSIAAKRVLNSSFASFDTFRGVEPSVIHQTSLNDQVEGAQNRSK